MKSQSGFTLIEMVAVIIILAIMAATAMPRFVSLSGEARLSTLSGMVGALDSTKSLAKSKWVALNSGGVFQVDMGGTNVSVASSVVGTAAQGYPLHNQVGIMAALDNTTGFTSVVYVNNATNGNRVVYWPTGVTTSASCSVSYQSGVTTQAISSIISGAIACL